MTQQPGESIRRSFVFSKRRDLPPITPRLLDVLIRLRTAQDSDAPFDALTGVHKRTLNALIERGWIYSDPGRDGWRYRITALGLKALKVYEPQLKRYDGICPECGDHPKHVTRGGRVEGYCAACLLKQGRRKYALRIESKRPDTLCPRCHKRTRSRLPNGRVRTYCEPCTRRLKHRDKKRQLRSRLERVLAGEFIKCRQPGCEQPIHHTENSSYDFCVAHQREYMTNYNDRRRAESRAARKRRELAEAKW